MKINVVIFATLREGAMYEISEYKDRQIFGPIIADRVWRAWWKDAHFTYLTSCYILPKWSMTIHFRLHWLPIKTTPTWDQHF